MPALLSAVMRESGQLPSRVCGESVGFREASLTECGEVSRQGIIGGLSAY